MDKHKDKDRGLSRITSYISGEKPEKHKMRSTKSGVDNHFGGNMTMDQTKQFCQAITDKKLDELLEKMMNDTDIKEASRGPIRKGPRPIKEQMVVMWMFNSNKALASDSRNHSQDLLSWRTMKKSELRTTLEAVKVGASSNTVNWLKEFCSPVERGGDSPNDPSQKTDGLSSLVEIMRAQTVEYLETKRKLKYSIDMFGMTQDTTRLDAELRRVEFNIKNLVLSICKIGNVGFGYKRLVKEFRAIKALCLTLNPDIPLSVIHQSSKLLAVVAIDVDGQSHIIRALTENAEEFTDENGFPKSRFKT